VGPLAFSKIAEEGLLDRCARAIWKAATRLEEGQNRALRTRLLVSHTILSIALGTCNFLQQVFTYIFPAIVQNGERELKMNKCYFHSPARSRSLGEFDTGRVFAGGNGQP
jgi:hypothetical protein